MSNDYVPPVSSGSWHPDPQDPNRQRWWNGSEWTENVRAASMLPPIANPNLVGGIVPEAAASPAMPSMDPLHAPEQGSPWTSQTPMKSEIRVPSGYVPMASMGSSWSSGQARMSMVARSSFTPGLWFVGLLPLVYLAAVYAIFEFVDLDQLNSIVRWGLALGPLVLSMAAAHWDSRTLVQRGRSTAPPAVLAVIPPLYLLVRAFRAAGSSLTMLLLWVLIAGTAAALLLTHVSVTLFGITLGTDAEPPLASATPTALRAADFEAPFTAEKRAYILTPQGMAEKLRYDYGVAGALVKDIVCEPLTSTEPTSQTRCSGTLLGTPLLVTVVVASDTDTNTSPIFITG